MRKADGVSGNVQIMLDQTNDLLKQRLTVNNDCWMVDMYYESEGAEEKIIEVKSFENTICLINEGYLSSQLSLRITDKQGNVKNTLITGIEGGIYLYDCTEENKDQSVKLLENNIIITCGFTFMSFSLDKQKIDWQIRSNMGEFFEFYALEKDYLVRGELSIYRINKHGSIVWEFGGYDIWVNIDGKPEVQLEKDTIRLTDFQGNVYVIDYDGKLLEFTQLVAAYKKKKRWWEIWK